MAEKLLTIRLNKPLQWWPIIRLALLWKLSQKAWAKLCVPWLRNALGFSLGHFANFVVELCAVFPYNTLIDRQ